MAKIVTGISMFLISLVLWVVILIGSAIAAFVSVAYWGLSR